MDNGSLYLKIIDAASLVKDEQGKTVMSRAPGGSVQLPLINNTDTRVNVKNITNELLINNSHKRIKATIINLINWVKDNYLLSHDGFRKTAKSNSKKHFAISVSEIYLFSVTVSFFFEELNLEFNPTFPEKIGIGVMSPSKQDCGKNIIRMCWLGAGYETIDLGINLSPKQLIDDIKHHKFDAIGLSCMLRNTVPNLVKFLELIKQIKCSTPVIIGGIAVNKLMAIELSEKYDHTVFYGNDISDATDVLKKVLNEVANQDGNREIKQTKASGRVKLERWNDFKIHYVKLEDIAIDKDARKGCFFCPDEKKDTCPIELGYEKVKSIEESNKFIDSHDFALLVGMDLLDDNRVENKAVWLSLLKLEQLLAKEYGFSYAFRFPIICPFCKPVDCTLKKGHCVFNSYYRPLHETYNINITNTLENIFQDCSVSQIYSLILVKNT